MLENIKIIVEDGPLRVLYAPGRNNTLVVSCSGVGNKRKVAPPPEFSKMASHGGENHVLWVIDESRSWLNAPGMAERLVATIEMMRETIGATRLVGLGNSMGATMLLHLSRLVDFDTILAFTPQYSVDPIIIPDETRWFYFRRKIESLRFPCADYFRLDRTIYFIMHGDTTNELIHALRFPNMHGLTHLIFPGYGHTLTAQLKKQGKLTTIVNLAITGRHLRLRKKLIRHGALPRTVYESQNTSRGLPEFNTAA